MIEGEALDDVINPLIAEDQAARLASLEESFGLTALRLAGAVPRRAGPIAPSRDPIRRRKLAT